jgi:hypothetical protein
MKTKKIRIAFVLAILLGQIIGFSQESFEVVKSSNQNEFLYYTFEDDYENFITMGCKNRNFGPDSVSALIMKINLHGNIVNEKTFSKTDTSYEFNYGLQKKNGNYFILGTLTDTVSKYDFNITYLCELDQDLNLVWEKMHTIPNEYNHHSLLNFLIDPDSNLLIQGKVDSSMNGSNDLLYISRISLEGDLLEFKFYESWKDFGSYGAFLYNFDSTGYILMSSFATGTAGFLKEWVELDLNLNITNQVSVIDPDHYISTPISAKWLSSGNLIVADRATMEPGANQDLYVKIMDPDLNMLKDTLIFYDEWVYLPVNNGLDFIDENNIWIATFEGVPPNFPGSEVFRIHIFDSDLNLKGLKVFGGAMRYWFYDLKATSDGGCLMTGVRPDYNGSYNQDGYIIKVMPQDIITNAEETPFEFDSDVAVYPNPFTDYIKLETVREGLRFSLFSSDGKMVMSEKLLSTPYFALSTSGLRTGLYYYNVHDNSYIIQRGKLIKQ